MIVTYGHQNIFIIQGIGSAKSLHICDLNPWNNLLIVGFIQIDYRYSFLWNILYLSQGSFP